MGTRDMSVQMTSSERIQLESSVPTRMAPTHKQGIDSGTKQDAPFGLGPVSIVCNSFIVDIS